MFEDFEIEANGKKFLFRHPTMSECNLFMWEAVSAHLLNLITSERPSDVAGLVNRAQEQQLAADELMKLVRSMAEKCLIAGDLADLLPDRAQMQSNIMAIAASIHAKVLGTEYMGKSQDGSGPQPSEPMDLPVEESSTVLTGSFSDPS